MRGPYEEVEIPLHSETITAIRRDVGGVPFDIAVTNGRTRVWAERFDEIEPDFLAWCDVLKSDDVLWDLGASIGHFATYAALVSGAQVVAFEPEALNYGHCALNRYLNRDALGGRLITLNAGIAETSGLETMHMRLFGAGEHTKTLKATEPASYAAPVLMLSSADVLALELPAPTAVKIDVDGSEANVIRALASLWPGVRHLFIELPTAELDSHRTTLAAYGLALVGTTPVARMRGGTYDNIVNVRFARDCQDDR